MRWGIIMLLRRSVLGAGAGGLLAPAIAVAQAKEKLTVVNAHHTN
jgi:predicted flavoprotein YhiN